ncbi:hypothetical protein A374_16453 [Fictibacillus macauensis ZFHKF-1]|uniref:DUF4829 domain-containing protein n=1 Tax=Fictibacillus macauensis ZFHKF-1 TaxID=1196324 RepID=I8AF11_9BACL|nr:hypothetical protein [Fictibacillus macauensis]EIT84212.1 hypothetical protein A374_16453 [Fictibacillus macauensis ZFHKF-1]
MRYIVCVLFSLLLCLYPLRTEAIDERESCESQISSFVTGLRAETAKQAVELWILGVKNRSGAVQYAELSPLLQKQTRKAFADGHWTTGQSSPWVDHFQLKNVSKISKNKYRYTVVYDLITSYENFGSRTKTITVEKNPAVDETNWFITKITTRNAPYEAFTPAETILHE